MTFFDLNSLGTPRYALSLLSAASPEGLFFGSMPRTILVIMVSGLRGWNGPNFGLLMLAISRNFRYSSITISFLPLNMMFSELTMETRDPFISILATWEQSLPATWFVPSTMTSWGPFDSFTCACSCLANYSHSLPRGVVFYQLRKIHYLAPGLGNLLCTGSGN